MKALEAEVRTLKNENYQLRDQVSFFRKYYGQAPLPAAGSAPGPPSGPLPAALSQSPLRESAAPSARPQSTTASGGGGGGVGGGGRQDPGVRTRALTAVTDDEDEVSAALRLLTAWATGAGAAGSGSGGPRGGGAGAAPRVGAAGLPPGAGTGEDLAVFGTDTFSDLTRKAEETALAELVELQAHQGSLAEERCV